MVELQAKDFSSFRPLAARMRGGAELADAVLSGHTQGRVFTGGEAETRSLFVYDQGLCAITGPIASEDFAGDCLAWLYGHGGQDFFVLFPGDASWVSALDAVATPPVAKVQRVGFRFERTIFEAQRSSAALEPGFVLARMDAALMGKEAVAMYPWIAGTWKSAAHFEEIGVGACVLAQGRIVSLCYSIFVSGHRHAVDIYTLAAFRKRGLARAAATAFVDACLARGLQPQWDCFKDNLASCQLAQLLGFVPADEFPVYSWQRPVP